jgi:hypothetical protein
MFYPLEAGAVAAIGLQLYGNNPNRTLLEAQTAAIAPENQGVE